MQRQYNETCAKAACMKIFYRSIKILRKKTKNVENCEFVRKYIYTLLSAWMLVQIYICVRVCVHVHVCIYCACVCTGEIRCRRRRRCSFVFSVLSDDCWRPWQQLTDLANAKANCGACCSVLVVNRWNTHRHTHTLAYIHTIVRSFVCVCKCITHMNKIYTLRTEM